MIHGTGFGKIILFGEHFVVHGLPAIVASLERFTTATITLTPGQSLELIDQRPFASGVVRSAEKEADYRAMAQCIMKYFGVTHELSINLGGNLTVTNGGIGASAAAAVSIATALNNYFLLGLNHETLYTVALYGENAVHGNSSGVDIAAALYGGITRFCKNITNEKIPSIIPLTQMKQELFFAIIDSGKRCAVKDAIADIAKLRIAHPTTMDPLFVAYNNLVNRAHNALYSSDIQKIGLLMLENQQLLESLTVSSQDINLIIQQALNLGACGAKLTGSGRGGLVIALAPNEDTQQKITSFFARGGKYTSAVTIKNQCYIPPRKTILSPIF